MTRDQEAEAWRASGLTIAAWHELWEACHVSGFSGPMRAAWPDGGSALEQPAVTVAMFGLIEQAVQMHLEAERGRK